jgi:hypothetical protein
MSDLNDLIHTNAHNAFEVGVRTERERIIRLLQDYFELTQMPNELGQVTNNPEWDCGFQASIALVKAGQK